MYKGYRYNIAEGGCYSRESVLDKYVGGQVGSGGKKGLNSKECRQEMGGIVVHNVRKEFIT